ncbi:MAG: response regulator [Suipraeoptans sp.]
MKLLIVDDEKLTREGILNSINWESLGIFETLEADDGLNALKVANENHPDIILCDIRMPRMNGIQFAEQIKDLLPNTSIIFMSGYSDKEYLKAAIKLKAVTYVEKPLNPLEIEEAILSAKEEHLHNINNLENENIGSIHKSGKLALLFTKNYKENKDAINSLCSEMNILPTLKFTAYIVKTDEQFTPSDEIYSFVNEFKIFLESFHMNTIYTMLHDSYHVFHVYGENEPSRKIQTDIECLLGSRFKHFGSHYIGKGVTVLGISKVFQSYTSAVVALQSSFFFMPETVLEADNTDIHDVQPYAEAPTDSYTMFSELLLSKEKDEVSALLNTLYSFYNNNSKALQSQVKGLYFRLFTSLSDAAKEFGIHASIEGSHIPDSEDKIMQVLDKLFTFEALHTYIKNGVSELFILLEESPQEDSNIYLIKEFIGKNYERESLSVKEISDHVYLSVSYVCTYFKNQTGTTLNQYITEYRMQRALQLLKDPRNQISDISSKVGYSNGNYFSKSFKKYTGVSPSKYRENISL